MALFFDWKVVRVAPGRNEGRLVAHFVVTAARRNPACARCDSSVLCDQKHSKISGSIPGGNSKFGDDHLVYVASGITSHRTTRLKDRHYSKAHWPDSTVLLNYLLTRSG